jgi:hypothetical protein
MAYGTIPLSGSKAQYGSLDVDDQPNDYDVAVLGGLWERLKAYQQCRSDMDAIRTQLWDVDVVPDSKTFTVYNRYVEPNVESKRYNLENGKIYDPKRGGFREPEGEEKKLRIANNKNQVFDTKTQQYRNPKENELPISKSDIFKIHQELHSLYQNKEERIEKLTGVSSETAAHIESFLLFLYPW